jgi:diaminopimelate decarboxylase/aspartate kinase
MIKYIVLKYGGTSVSTYEKWLDICKRVIELRYKYKVIVVVSALSGVTNKLQSIISPITSTRRKYELLEEILEQHQALADEGGIKLPDLTRTYYNDVYEIITSNVDISESPQLQAVVLATGELMSSSLGYAILEKQHLVVALIDARNVIRTT